MIDLFTICLKRAKIMVRKLSSFCQNLTKHLLCSRKPSGLWTYETEGHSLYGNRNAQQDSQFFLG